jgi:asparagine synthase (glutamine-hydrolysing)
MCGICGYTYIKDNLNHREVITGMLEAILHRGPDDEGIYIDQKAILGTRRLSIIDLHTGNQPIHNEDKDIWITYNGEIYNYQELREFLENKGHRFYSKTDTEVVIHLYEEFGEECVKMLNGMFAFAIWDAKREVLFLARDRFGMKPLYYSDCGDNFIFASELKSILKFPKFKKELDLISLDQYLTFEYVPSPRSIFKRIRKLPAAHLLIYKNRNISLVKYWDIDSSQRCNLINEVEVEEKLLELLKNAIKEHLVSDVPLGIFLSGGIDSSIITALASNLMPVRMKTFSIGFKEDSFDESRYINQIAKLYHTEHYHEFFEMKDLFDLLSEAIHFLDEPFGDASFFSTYLLSKFAKQNITVALSGDGGDEIFAGYPTYQAHRLIKYNRLIPYFIRKNIINKIVMNLPVSMSNFSFDFKAKKFISADSLSMQMRHIYWMGSFNYQDKCELYAPTSRELLDAEDNFDIVDSYFNNIKTVEPLDTLQYFDIKTYLQDDILVKTDRASMASSLEVRVPYLDHRLVEFAFSLPSNLRLNHLKTKYILKKTASNFLPQSIVHRKKKGFGIPVAFWIKGGFKHFVLDILKKDKIRKEGIFNYQFIEELLKQHFSNKIDNRKKIWTLVMFELWLKEYTS